MSVPHAFTLLVAGLQVQQQGSAEEASDSEASNSSEGGGEGEESREAESEGEGEETDDIPSPKDLFEGVLAVLQEVRGAAADGAKATGKDVFSIERDILGASAADTPLPAAPLMESVAHNALGELLLDEAYAVRGKVDKAALARARVEFNTALSIFPENPSALLSLAVLDRDAGRLEDSLKSTALAAALPVDAVRLAVEQGTSPDWVELLILDPLQVCVPLAASRQTTLLFTLGRYPEAQASLRRFGLGYSISPQVWDVACGRSAGSRPEQPPCRVYPNAVPPELHERLLAGFSPRAPYWDENDYDQSEYFSWWFDVKSEPKTAVEELILELLPLTERDDIIGAEWWVHTRPVSGGDIGHQLHFDTDERTLENTGRIMHPAFGSVVYLSGQGSTDGKPHTRGGSTVIFDQTPSAEKFAERAWIMHPQDRAFMLFSGDRLHGVLPSMPESQPSSTEGSEDAKEPAVKRAKTDIVPDQLEDEGQNRLTLLIGWWNSTKFDEPDDGSTAGARYFGARAAAPPDVEWPKHLKPGKRGTSGEWARGVVCDNNLVSLATSAWEAVPGSPAKNPELELPRANDQRFYANAPTDFINRMMEEHRGEGSCED
jgi:tetratricopeptide (TPR) repeat protein